MDLLGYIFIFATIANVESYLHGNHGQHHRKSNLTKLLESLPQVCEYSLEPKNVGPQCPRISYRPQNGISNYVLREFGGLPTDNEIDNYRYVKEKLSKLEAFIRTRLGDMEDAVNVHLSLSAGNVRNSRLTEDVVHAGESTKCDHSPELSYFRDCLHAYNSGHRENGIYYIKPDYSSCPIPVSCDMKTAEGGWLILLRRVDGEVEFDRGWQKYQHGFGNLSADHYLGNDNIFLISNQDNYTLRVDIRVPGNMLRYAEYEEFYIGGKPTEYKLHIGKYSGTAGDGFYCMGGQKFSTVDRNNNVFRNRGSGVSCAEKYKAGWWFGSCRTSAVLTGPFEKGLIWTSDGVMPLMVELKMRPKV